jgi:hypothetical protein
MDITYNKENYIMVHRKFNGLKFRRTFIGGSKQEELKIFAEVQGTKEDNSECNWLEYRRILMQYSDDILNVIFSWRYVFGILRMVFAVLALLILFANPIPAIFVLGLSGIFQILFIHQKNKEMKRLSVYNFSLDIINQQTGLALSKN